MERGFRCRRQGGVALAYLLWMLAGLSLLVSGAMTLSLGDVRATALQLDQARARAVGTGAAHLLLRDLTQGSSKQGAEAPEPGALFIREYEIGGYRALARAIPVSGLVSLTGASAELLALLFEHAGGLSPGQALALGEAVVAWREGQETVSEEEAPPGFQVVEDLLRVPGMTRSVYDRVRAAVHAQSGSATVDPQGAPRGVLSALAAGDEALVESLEARREPGADRSAELPPGLSGEHAAPAAGGSAYSVEVDVTLGDDRVLRQRIWADTTSRSGVVPWRFNRVEPVVGVGRAENEE